MTNGLSDHYHFDESTFTFRGFKSIFLFHISMDVLSANRITPDGTPRFAATHLGRFFLPLSHKKAARLIWVNGELRN